MIPPPIYGVQNEKRHALGGIDFGVSGDARFMAMRRPAK